MSENRIYIDTTKIIADVYHQNDKGVYYVKVSIPSLSMYINSFRVSESPKYPEKGLWVQWPSFKVGFKWIKPIEFSNDSELRGLVDDAVLRAVDAYSHDRLIVPEDFDVNFEQILDDAIKELPP